ncbi:MAG: hypothetical protein AAGD96_00775 [Chloroflexota bacterium]
MINAGVHTTSYFLVLWYALRLLRVSNCLAEATELADHIIAQHNVSNELPPLVESVLVESAALKFERGDRSALWRNLTLCFARLQGDMQTLNVMLANETEGETGSAELQFEAKIETAWGYLAEGEPAQVLAIIDHLRQSVDNRFGFLSVPYYLLTRFGTAPDRLFMNHAAPYRNATIDTTHHIGFDMLVFFLEQQLLTIGLAIVFVYCFSV